MSTSPHATRRSKVASNQRLPCMAPRCDNKRGGLSRYCFTHRNRLARTGHTEGRDIKPSEWAQERAEVARFITARIDDKAGQVRAALQWITHTFLCTVGRMRATPGELQRDRLRRFHVAPLDILTVAAALHLFHTRNPRLLPFDDLRLPVATAMAVVRLLPDEARTMHSAGAGRYRVRHQDVGSVARREVGETLRDGLFHIAANIADAIHSETAAKAHMHHRLRLPFTTSGVQA